MLLLFSANYLHHTTSLVPTTTSTNDPFRAHSPPPLTAKLSSLPAVKLADLPSRICCARDVKFFSFGGNGQTVPEEGIGNKEGETENGQTGPR
jgi:hypothetical protein